jgi:hypothetical protein
VSENMERGLLLRKRMRHELARSLLTSEDDPVVQSFLEATRPVQSVLLPCPAAPPSSWCRAHVSLSLCLCLSVCLSLCTYM